MAGKALVKLQTLETGRETTRNIIRGFIWHLQRFGEA